MDELIKQLGIAESLSPAVEPPAVVFSLVLAALLSLVVGATYRRIHAEVGYSQRLVHTIVLLSMITSLIMIIIGSNIARAFSLVGALSIIRFRTAIKSPLDVGFLFLGIAVGMACGTQFHVAGAIGVALVCSVMLILHATDFAVSPKQSEYLLSVRFHANVDHQALLEPVLARCFDAHSLAYTETVRQGTQREVVHSVRAKEGVGDKDVLDAVVEVNDNLKVVYRTIRHAADVP